MHRASSIFGSAIFLVAAPGDRRCVRSLRHLSLAPYSPSAWLVSLARDRRFHDRRRDSCPARFFVRFAIQGLGTPAPIAPPQRLVVTGLYRWVRNPMYVAVLLLVIGQGLLFGSVRLLEYGIIVWLGFFAFVLLYEEPQLHRKFGQNTRSSVLRSPAGFPA